MKLNKRILSLGIGGLVAVAATATLATTLTSCSESWTSRTAKLILREDELELYHGEEIENHSSFADKLKKANEELEFYVEQKDFSSTEFKQAYYNLKKIVDIIYGCIKSGNRDESLLNY